jgi:hypothetical protein
LRREACRADQDARDENGEMAEMSEMANCGQTNAGKNVGMSKAHNERMTLEQQIQPLATKDIRAFFPAIALSAVRHFGHL